MPIGPRAVPASRPPHRPRQNSHMPHSARLHAVRMAAAGRVAVVLASLVVLAGCSTQNAFTRTIDEYVPIITQFGVYKLDINQGNYLSQDMVDKLKEGQTKAQVRATLGTPLI